MITTEQREIEMRSERRRHLIYYLAAFDSKTNEPIGHIYDITTKGVLLLSDEIIDVGREIDFTVMLPDGLVSSRSFSMRAECRWSERDVNPDNFCSGFQFTYIDRSAVVLISSLIARFGFQN